MENKTKSGKEIPDVSDAIYYGASSASKGFDTAHKKLYHDIQEMHLNIIDKKYGNYVQLNNLFL